MNLDRTLLVDELPNRVGLPIMELAKEHVIGLVSDYNEALRQHGQYIEMPDREELVRHLLESAKIKVKITAAVDEVKLEQWHIHPVCANQSKLSEYEEDEKFSPEEIKAFEERDRMLEKRRQAAAEQAGGE